MSEQLDLLRRPERKPVLLISLVPKYWDLVVAGTKRYEYRKAFTGRHRSLYRRFLPSLRPRLGFIDFDAPIIGNPMDIADLAETQSLGCHA